MESGVVGNAIQRGPLPVQMSIGGPWLPRVQLTACDTVGASAPNRASHKASHSTQRRCDAALVVCRQAGNIKKPGAPYGLAAGMRGMEWWSMAAGAAKATGTLSSILLSTPLASLNTSVSGTVLSLASGAFRSIIIMW